MKSRSAVGWSFAAVIVIGCALLFVSHRFTASASSRSKLNTTLNASPSAKDGIPLAVVQRGDVDVTVHATGVLRASHTMMLAAPSVGGGSLQITHLLPTSTPVKKGDIVVEFDPSEQHYKFEQSRSELLQAEQEITKAKADAAVLAAQDKVAALKARYDVRQAELDVQKNEILSAIDGKKNLLTLQQAQRVQAELVKDIESHKESGQASIFLAQEKYNKAKLAMGQAQQNIDKMSVTAPMDGLVSVQKNMPTEFFFTGMSVPDYHTGDQVNPGSQIAQIVDPMGLEISSKLKENNSGSVKVGSPVDVTFDAMPGQTFRGTVKSVGGMSSPQAFWSGSGGSFEVTMQLAQIDPRLHSGFSAKVLFIGDAKKNVLYLPRQAVFLKEGKRVVYVKAGSSYEQRTVKIIAESESRSVVDGLAEGMQVALVDPTVPQKSAAPGDLAAPAGPGGN
jgi:multidrug efflux pump subunit AcrA (membrane-fusion protein)